MNPLALRSVCARARPEVQRTGYALKNYFRHFSTSQSLAPDEASTPTPPSQPSVRQRTRDAASQISSLVKRGRGGSRGSSRGGGSSGQRQAAQPPAGSAPKVIDVKSLPKGAAASRAAARRERGAARARDDDKDKQKKLGRRQDPFEAMDPYEEQFDRDMRFGAATAYAPRLTPESLAPFAPATPSSAAGRRATVLGNLSALGTADPVGVPQDLQARSYAEDLESEGLRFFADAKAREAAERYLQEKRAEGKGEGEGEIIRDAGESVRSVVLDKAVRGEHEKMVFTEGPVGVARNWHLRAETYTGKDVESFEKKLNSLVGKGAGKKGEKKAAATV
ncbi:hypothetical protein MAJ_02611, partial [Metarhizium majus ARSEF 297]